MRLPLLLLLAAALGGCQTAPVTGRAQFILVDEAEVASLSAGEFAKMRKLPNDPRLAKIREIGLKVVAAARRDDRNGVLPPPDWSCAKGESLAKFGLPVEDYAEEGGAVPIRVAGAGVVAVVTVSGLAQVDDHNLAVAALRQLKAGL